MARIVASSSIDARRSRVVAQLFGPRRADDRARDVRLVEDPGERELGHRDPEAVRDRPQALNALEHVVVDSSCIHSRAPTHASPRTAASPGAYFPLSTPCASGE